MNPLWWIALGGALGAVLRYLMVLGVGSLFPLPFPLGTLSVNLFGCFLIGVVYAAFSASPHFQESILPFVVIGLLGGFTTFSSYAMELVTMLRNQQETKAFGYFILSNVGGLAFAWVGYKLFAT